MTPTADITLLLGVDARHLHELRWVWPTWVHFKPELLEMPLVVFYDASQVELSRLQFLQKHPNLRLLPWELAGARNQREKMLTGFVQVAAREVKTPWYLKIDTDVIATRQTPWLQPEWFLPDEEGRVPAFVSSPWGYSKPRYVVDLLDDWGDEVPQLVSFPRLDLPYSSESDKVVHPRIISWLFFGNTHWTQEMAACVDVSGRLPYPSQDTFLFYCAARTGARMIRTRMSRYGWEHTSLRQVKRKMKEMGLKPAA